MRGAGGGCGSSDDCDATDVECRGGAAAWCERRCRRRWTISLSIIWWRRRRCEVRGRCKRRGINGGGGGLPSQRRLAAETGATQAETVARRRRPARHRRRHTQRRAQTRAQTHAETRVETHAETRPRHRRRHRRRRTRRPKQGHNARRCSGPRLQVCNNISNQRRNGYVDDVFSDSRPDARTARRRRETGVSLAAAESGRRAGLR